MAGTTQISGAELAPQIIVAEISKWVDGKLTAQEVIGASRHTKLRIIRAYAMLTEVADAAGTTLTVKLTNGTTDCTDTLTFTQAVEAVGDIKAFTLVSNQDVVLAASALTVTTAGTTTTLGELVVVVDYENTN